MPHVDLLELPYFEGISMDALVSLVDLMEPRQFAKGEVIMTEGERVPPSLYIATSGRVLITKRGERSHERPLAELDAPTLFGEIELFCQIPSVASARAITPIAAFTLGRDVFDRLFTAHHPAIMRFTFNVAKVACHRLAIADEMMTRILGDEDLVTMRRAVFSSMNDSNEWTSQTGAFKRPNLK